MENIGSGLRLAVLAIVFGVHVFTDASPSIHITQSPSRSEIYVTEKIIVNNTFRFTDVITEDVIITLEPTVDVPDMVIKQVREIRLGYGLYITGDLAPIEDYGNKHLQSKKRGALSIEFHLGNVHNDGKDKGFQADNTFFVQYEAEVLLPLLMGLGHRHQFGASVATGNTVDSLYVTGTYTTTDKPNIPLLFRTLAKQNPAMGDLGTAVNKMTMEQAEGAAIKETTTKIGQKGAEKGKRKSLVQKAVEFPNI
ncbi:hypothetical protein MAR_016144 [Mya arenaria]|uniref:Uncharacterized protein n=1 Tax=Mya arenaria TaxID=6604 RepID=A0ABY7FJA7_MYAAR|nr:uncharacterized protein LOC128210941 [Mya arenaria]WAR22170.1 hypothetical protein MAR_016144 [Mya arenaria]